MATKLRITDLPLELRQQIFREYFKVEGGYVYDGQADKLRNADDTPIDLSLSYTCRSIANDCNGLPLAVNTIHFSTLYREDWRSLAGCFNLVATYYYVLQQDIVLHLAHLITPEMHAQLENKFPGFRSKLEAERAFHSRAWATDNGVRSDQDLDNTDTSNHTRPAACQFIRKFYNTNIGDYDGDDPTYFRGYAWIHEDVPYNSRTLRTDICEIAYKRWDTYSGEVRQCLTHCLRLIADENPEEFGNQVYTSLPHWVGKYPAKEFFDLRFDCWAIPSQSQLRNAMGRLEIPDIIWDLPNTWDHHWIYKNVEDFRKNVPPDQCLNHNEPLPLEFNFRGREKSIFSAAAAAIRFLGLLSDTQRNRICSLILHEDAPCVNIMSLHGNGLLPFIRENPSLRIERRVSVIDTTDVTHERGMMSQITGAWAEGNDWSYIPTETMIPHVSQWVLDAIAIEKEDIPAGSLTLLLESHPYADACTEAFQHMIHNRIACGKAFRKCMEENFFEGLTDREMKALGYKVSLEDGFEEAIMHLVNQTSDVIRCDFNPGVPENYQTLVNKVRDWGLGFSESLGYRLQDLTEIEIQGECYKQSVLKAYEFETQEEYLRSRARDSQQG
ncbi:hypothetical protein FPOAC2_10472 [Fusarium poae]|jgi:hypothetical protein|uniref:Uncharacterized protein n=1 Tax=Fusarium poae TaxID=36050 RepID=A0A1B8AB44_FUSPO|nr:hypothetical protein FPOAC1_010196 [Fusarium poae]KAG8665401.1 hypothetical protein FPOAC1_010196 [Fusarium poae]OBS17701.1 hypothetical protein FPOA_09434 [Fusarium poae]